jgi:hypothetical protein
MSCIAQVTCDNCVNALQCSMPKATQQVAMVKQPLQLVEIQMRQRVGEHRYPHKRLNVNIDRHTEMIESQEVGMIEHSKRVRSYGVQDASRERDERDWAELFSQAEQADVQTEAHGAHTCVLTMEPFRDPVCTPDGNSFERGALLDHLQKVRV